MNWFRISFWAFVAVISLQLLIVFILLGIDILSLLGALIWGGILLVLSLAGITLAVIHRHRIWPQDPIAIEQRHLRRSARKQFCLVRDRARAINRRSLSVPWNLFLACETNQHTTVMTELGYVRIGEQICHKGLSVTTWTSPTAVAYRIALVPGEALSFEFLNVLLKLLLRHRPSLAVNAAYFEYELSQLMSPNPLETENLSTINRILNVACKTFGLDIPLHFAIAGLEHLPDVHRTALAAGYLRDKGVLGGFIDRSAPSLNAGIEALFKDMVHSLNATQQGDLQKQLVSEDCTAIVNAPMQLALIQVQVRERLALLTQALPPRRDRLNLQSIAFVGACESMPMVDPLSQVSSQRFFQTQTAFSPQEDLRESVTAESAASLANYYYLESNSIRQNNRYRAQLNLNAGMLSAFLAFLVIALAGLIWDNTRQYKVINQQTSSTFEDYYSKVGVLGENSDTLVDRVLLLAPLRKGLIAYDILDMSFYRWMLPNGSKREVFQQLYNDELTGGLQLALANYLEKDMFAFNALEDGVELVNLASLEVQFHENQRDNSHHLTRYFRGALAEQGEVSAEFQLQFAAQLRDLFQLNQPLGRRNEELRQVVAKTISGLATADLLYEALIRQGPYAERVDLRRTIGPRFSQVFNSIDRPQTYMVPRAFTQEGFELLFENGEIPDLATLISSYENLIGPLEAAKITAINRRVSDRYTADYISTWTTFINALSLRSATNWSDAQILMSALTNLTENPITGLGNALRSNTDITPTKGSEEAPSSPSIYSAELGTARNIREAFRLYLDAVKQQDQKQNQFDLFLQYASDVTVWLQETALTADGASRALFDQFQAGEQANPLAKMHAFATRSDLELIRSFGSTLSEGLDKAAMGFVYAYINNQWQQQVITPFGQELTGTFPFDPLSHEDMPLSTFTTLFMPDGVLDIFEKSYLSHFKNVDGLFNPQVSFIPTGTAELTQEAIHTFTQFGKIRESLFVDGKPFLAFTMRTSFMEGSLSRLVISSNVTLHKFTHGPILWSEQTWPVSGVNNSDISFRFYQRSRPQYDRVYSGPWSWFRLFHDGYATINPTAGLAETSFTSKSGAQVNLQFDSNKRFSPFAPEFFSGVQVGEPLFIRQEVPREKFKI
ncbi:ImcF-related family protein [Flexibacterium corallicola]|uniref:ImcF-related family protein n=1 Tax=Flexibacterium corallicola TaxID=3037259 RepID=UPI00286EF1E5|nr:ImcF-related family protein [Pseudovibrio sp. M1P-2-3]